MSILKSCLSIIIVFFGSISLNAQLCLFPIITAELTTGIWAGEISWEITDSNGSQVAGPYYRI